MPGLGANNFGGSLMASDTQRWSEDNSGGIVVQLCRQDGSDSRARSMRDLLPFGLTRVKGRNNLM